MCSTVDLAPWNSRAHNMMAVCVFSVCIPDYLHSLLRPCRSVFMFLFFNILTTAQIVLLYPSLHLYPPLLFASCQIHASLPLNIYLFIAFILFPPSPSLSHLTSALASTWISSFFCGLATWIPFLSPIISSPAWSNTLPLLSLLFLTIHLYWLDGWHLYRLDTNTPHPRPLSLFQNISSLHILCCFTHHSLHSLTPPFALPVFLFFYLLCLRSFLYLTSLNSSLQSSFSTSYSSNFLIPRSLLLFPSLSLT